MTQHREINITNLTVEVSASYNGGQLEDELQQMGWTLGHSPQSLYQSTVGGWLSTLATGQFSSYYGGIEELVTAYTVILATGEKLRLKASPRAAMGPDLRQLFIGAEGTLGIVTSVQLKIFPLPQTRLYDSLELLLSTLVSRSCVSRPWRVCGRSCCACMIPMKLVMQCKTHCRINR